jgi:hypothetical protein
MLVVNGTRRGSMTEFVVRFRSQSGEEHRIVVLAADRAEAIGRASGHVPLVPPPREQLTVSVEALAA